MCRRLYPSLLHINTQQCFDIKYQVVVFPCHSARRCLRGSHSENNHGPSGSFNSPILSKGCFPNTNALLDTDISFLCSNSPGGQRGLDRKEFSSSICFLELSKPAAVKSTTNFLITRKIKLLVIRM